MLVLEPRAGGLNPGLSLLAAEAHRLLAGGIYYLGPPYLMTESLDYPM